MDDKVLQEAIEVDGSQTCDELARQFNTSSERVRFHLHRLSKTCKLSKWVPHTLWKSISNNEWQPVYRCHPPYSPDLAPSYHHLFHSLENHIRCKVFTNEAGVCQALFAFHTPEFNYKGIEQLETRWQKVLDAYYF
ncbi:histone-lysine N-methyltransferase SETMAR [Trichonephila clavipes]|nr:histone-lysine N-methyltransferase SETMAR [Trichonephila clavipes]